MHDSRLSDHFTNSHTFKTTRPERLKREGSSLEEKMLSTEYSFRRTELCWLFKKTRGFFSNSNGQRRLFLNNAHKSAENQGSFHLRKNWREKGVKTVNALTPFIFWAWWCFWSGSRLCIDCILLGENCQHVGNTNWELYVMCVLKNKWGLMLSRQGSFILRKRALSLRLLFFLRKIPKRALSSIRLGFFNNKRILSTILVGKYGHTHKLTTENTKLNH